MNDTTRDWTADHVHAHFHAKGWGRPPGRGLGATGRGWGGGGRRRMRRGDVRRAILSALLEGPAHGYEIMQRLEARSGGVWRPSPGSVYPTLQMLEDEGMVRAQVEDGTRTYDLTESGRASATAEDQGSGGWRPWEGGGDENLRALIQGMGQTMVAVRQIAKTGTAAQIERANELVQRTRKELYQLLAED